jgi:threonine aldolase
MIADFRSDTITRPTLAMKAAMFEAEVGDDVFQEDPTVQKLQQKVAELFGMEAALFCPSGTMANQIAIKVLTQPQDEIICDHKSHIYLYEGGGTAFNSLVSLKLLEGDRGRLTASQIKEAINPDDIHFASTSLISLENTMNKGGGSCYSLTELRQIKALADANGLKMHLDGSRLFNALVATGDNPLEYGQLFDTITVSFSKGLGAPVGSCLIMKGEYFEKARRVRKVLGGGMRQSGYLAAAANYALDNHIGRLAIDHERAIQLAFVLSNQSYVKSVLPTETNIVIATVRDSLAPEQVLQSLNEKGIRAIGFGKREIRMVTHLDITQEMMDYTIEQLSAINL